MLFILSQQQIKNMETGEQVTALIASNLVFVGAFIRLDREQDRLDLKQLSTFTKEQLESIRQAGSVRETNIITEIKKSKDNQDHVK
jgi:hypothetical protein